MDSVESIVRTYFDALSRSDVQGVVSVFAEDGILMGDELETLTGQEQIRRTLQGMFQTMSVQVQDLHVDEVREEDDLAVARTHTTDTIKILASNSVVSAGYRELFNLRKTANGWRITDYIFNRPGNPGP